MPGNGLDNFLKNFKTEATDIALALVASYTNLAFFLIRHISALSLAFRRKTLEDKNLLISALDIPQSPASTAKVA